MKQLLKVPSGIQGLDEITGGGFPAGRPVLICGGPGCGKTLFSMCFLVNGATMYKEPGVFVAFEERAHELAENVASLGFDLEKLQKSKKIIVDHVQIHRSEIDETGEYDLEGLFIRLEHAINSIGAKRVVLDTIENLFAGLNNQAIIRAELIRLFQWLKDKGVTAVITAEKGEGLLTRHGLEEYVSDCVILLDHRVINQISTRRLRIIKYRGSFHGSNEYPFLIDEDGISVLPITSLRLEKEVSSARISSGVPSLDKMLSGKGFFRGSSILISGTSGTGKTSLAAHFVKSACERKEKCLYFAFEESPKQIVRNMKSIGLDLAAEEKKGLLLFHSAHPAESGLELHLVKIYKLVKQYKPKLVVLDPITNLVSIGDMREVKSMLMRLLDMLQVENITVMFTALSNYSPLGENFDETMSSMVDTWIQVRDIENDGEKNRGLSIMKSRGMAHSNQIREFLISSAGLELVDIYVGASGVLTGSARRQAQKLQAVDGKDTRVQKERAGWASDRQTVEKRTLNRK